MQWSLLVTIGILIPLYVITVEAGECMGVHQARFLFALMVLLASMNIRV
jgi:hypothetical protein